MIKQTQINIHVTGNDKLHMRNLAIDFLLKHGFKKQSITKYISTPLDQCQCSIILRQLQEIELRFRGKAKFRMVTINADNDIFYVGIR